MILYQLAHHITIIDLYHDSQMKILPKDNLSENYFENMMIKNHKAVLSKQEYK